MHLLLIACCLLLAVWINFQVDGSGANSDPKWTYFLLPSEYDKRNADFQQAFQSYFDSADSETLAQTKCKNDGSSTAPWLLYWYVDCTNDNQVVFAYGCDEDEYKLNQHKEYLKAEKSDEDTWKGVAFGTTLKEVEIDGLGYEEPWSAESNEYKVLGKDEAKTYEGHLFAAIKDQLIYQKAPVSEDGPFPRPWSGVESGDTTVYQLCPCPALTEISYTTSQNTPAYMEYKKEGGIHYVKMLIACYGSDILSLHDRLGVVIALGCDLKHWDNKTATLVVFGTKREAIDEDKNEEREGEAQCDKENVGAGEGPTCKYKEVTCRKEATEKNGSMKISPGFTLFVASLLWMLAFKSQ